MLKNYSISDQFSNEPDSAIKQLIDIKREREDTHLRETSFGNNPENSHIVDMSFEGLGTLVVAMETTNTTSPLCMGLGSDGNQVKIVPCFHQHIVPSLAPGWETGGVVDYEVLPNNKWKIGPCSSDGSLKRAETGGVIMTPGLHTAAGPHCMLKQSGGKRGGRCLDIAGERLDPGGALQVYPCKQRWNQAFAFGNGELAPVSSIHVSVPIHLQKAKERARKKHIPHLCIGVYIRQDWKHTPSEEEERTYLSYYSDPGETSNRLGDGKTVPKPRAYLWRGKEMVTIPCSDPDAVLKFVFVPFITTDGNDTTVVVNNNAEQNDNRNEL